MSIRARITFVALSLWALLATTSNAFLTPIAAGQGANGSGASQVTAATIAGTVKDKDGLVPGATVVLTNVATGQTFPAAVTSAAGTYSFSGLLPGNYKVIITMASYKTVVVDVQLGSGASISIPTTLEAGKREEVISVTSASGLVRTDTPTVSQTVSADFIQALPRADRNALSFLTFLPGTTTVASATSERYNTTIAGLPSRQYNITIDGVTNNNLLQSTDGFFSQTVPRLNAVEEVTLRTGQTSGETYSQFRPNPFLSAMDHPLSTFGADVDTASYSNIRRYLSSGQLPPSQAVRIEEMVNYFRFGYAAPRDGRPIALTTELGDCPWAPGHKLVLVGARAAVPPAREITGRSLTLLIDVSGSMMPPERLPLLKTAFSLFVDTLRPEDSVSIVTYAGSSGIVLPPTSARRRDVIQQAIANLQAGGSTNGGQGIVLAYQVAAEAFKRGGVNRVILATDGDFNVGVTSQQELLSLIERQRQSGIFLSVFGVGSGNLKDATMEMLADRGNGNYAYLDSLQEARRVLIKEGDATLEAVAKDVKFQVEFNPAIVAAWKLIGYENRALAAQDFNNDRKDAGEMGAGHTVTVLYEIVPVGADRDTFADERPAVDPLKYQHQVPVSRPQPRPVDTTNGEWLTVKTRYKMPESDTSELMSTVLRGGGQQYLPLAAAVAEFGLILRDSPRDGERWAALSYRLNRMAVPSSLATDVEQFKELVETAKGLARIR